MAGSVRRRGPARGRFAATVVSGVLVTALVGCSGGADQGTSAGAAPIVSATATTPAVAAGDKSAAPSPRGSASSTGKPSASASHSPAVTPAATKPSHTSGRHTVLIVNATQQTIWVAVTQQKEHPIPRTKWKLAPGASTSVLLPTGWGGRIWARTGCHTDGSGRNVCQSGYCADSEACVQPDPAPTTLAEFALDAWSGLDFYDVSMVDGANLPMWINVFHTVTKDPLTSRGCSSAGCTRPIACPSAMRVTRAGTVVACKNPCAAFNTDATCCRGEWAGRENCVPSRWPVDYTQVFKKAEPFAYSYAFDDSATMSCKGGCDYRVTFGLTPPKGTT
ncbi:thaumatin family protein [Paractinoplanes globisporus]|uniref:Thaumatin family protein n=1 Tax=Paractinoplanes globisporus TaxID=113565 RepID=A0ABW6WBX4_9ACTN|nr:thaumatin family protein [Actinoplanes globisporus]